MTALAIVKSPNRLDGPSEITPAFKKKAEASDAKIEKLVHTIGTSYVSLAQEMRISKAEGYHVALGYNSFADYAEAKTGKSKSVVYEVMGIVKELTEGEKPAVKPADLQQMTQENAKGLANLKKNGVKITPKLVTQAKTMPAKEFTEQVVHPQHPVAAQRAAVARGTTVAGGAVVLMDLKYKGLLPQTVADMNRASEIARYATREESEDRQRDVPFQDRFLQALAAEFISTYEAEYEQAKMDEEAKGINAAVASNAAMGSELDGEEEDLLDSDDGELADEPEE